jgi:cyclophilin family peptidyl-prolyl cis-trans isomerase
LDRGRVRAQRTPRKGLNPLVEPLEGRQLLAASLAPIGPVSVTATLGTQVVLNGSASNASSQTFTATSNNPNITATVAQGKYVTFNVSHSAHDATDITFAGPITIQLFEDLTPQTVAKIESFITSGFYNSKTFHRVASGFPTTSDFILQGGSANGFGTGFSGQPGAPFPDEFNQQLSFSNPGELAMANSGPDTNDTQFFITTAEPTFLNFHHTILGQVVADPDGILTKMTKVELEQNPQEGTNAPKDFPVAPIQITSATLSNTNPNGVVHIDATKAAPGDQADITVKATDPTDNTTATQTFHVTAAANTQIERPFLSTMPYPTQVVTTTPGTTTQPAVVYTQSVAVGQKDIFQLPTVVPTPNDVVTYVVKAGVSADGQSFTDIPTSQGTATVDQNTGVVTFTPAAGFSGQVNMLVGVRDQVNRAAQSNPSATLDNPANFQWHQIILNVSGTTPVALTPIALPVNQVAATTGPTTIHLNGLSANPATSQGLTYALTTQPAHGTVSNFNATAGTFDYTPNANFTGNDTFQYTVTDSGTGTTNLTSPPANITVNVSLGSTHAVRQIGGVLVVTPPPRTDHGTNIINISQLTDVTNAANDKIQVTVNGVVDNIEPLVSDLSRIVVFGAKASDQISVDPSVSPLVPVTLDGGHGGRNTLIAAAGPSRLHGWFGRNVLVGGTGANQLVGRQGHVKFRPTSTTTEIFAGKGHPPQHFNKITPPSGAFFRFVNGRLVRRPTPHKRG